MAETAGLVIGVVSLAGLFTNCVDCFEYVQIGRHFGKDYQRCLLKLDVVELRLSRWAEAVNSSQAQNGMTVGGSANEARKVGEILEEIITLFNDAERISAKYKAKKTSSDELAVYHYDSDLDPDIRSIHTRMRQLALRRQKRSSFAQKAAWALYEGKHFSRLIEDVAVLVDALLELFPASQGRQQLLGAEEAEEMKDEPRLDALEEAAEGVDTLFQSSVQRVIASQKGHSFTNNVITDDARVRYGDEFSGIFVATGVGHSYDGNKISGTSRVHYGNLYGGKSVLDDYAEDVIDGVHTHGHH